ncbi:hypothetical protein [Streptococcus ferus]|uniref:hypothetical protein n=1 Tax=Streptococcus ferus TaxID=1345 RepID=UPI0035A1141D
MKKRLSLLVLVSLAAVFLAACQGGGNTQSGGSSSSEAQKPAKIYKHLLKADNEVWYVTKDLKASTEPTNVYIFNNGKVKGYINFLNVNNPGLTLDDLAKMSNREVIDYFEDHEAETLQKFYDLRKNVGPSFEDEVAMATALEPYMNGSSTKLSAVKYSMSLVTDTEDEDEDAGREIITIKLTDYESSGEIGNFLDYNVILKNPISGISAADSQFSGFETGDVTNPFFVTKGNQTFTFDESE